MNDTTRQMGGALGVAVIGSLVSSAYAGTSGTELDLAGRGPVESTSSTRRRRRSAPRWARRQQRRRGRRGPGRVGQGGVHRRAGGRSLVAAVIALMGALAAWRWVPGRHSLAWTTPPRRPHRRRQPRHRRPPHRGGTGAGAEANLLRHRPRAGGSGTGPSGLARDCGMRLVVWNLLRRHRPQVAAPARAAARPWRSCPRSPASPGRWRGGGLVPTEADWHWVGAVPEPRPRRRHLRHPLRAPAGPGLGPLVGRGAGRPVPRGRRSGRARRQAAHPPT